MPENSEKPPASSSPPPPGGPKPRPRWWRRIFRTLLIALLLAAIFHRPLLETGMRLALIKIAASHHVKLDVHFSGSFFTNLTIRDIRALPDGNGPTPIEKIAIESVRLDYSIPMLVKHGVGEFLRSYEVTNADLVFLATPSKTNEEHEQKKSVAEDLNNLLGQPALYADRVKIENFNVTVRSKDEVTEVKDVHLLFHPWEPGYLRIGRIKAPGLPAWENLSAQTSYANRNLFVKQLVLSPDLVIEEFNFDASQRSQNKGGLFVRSRLFGGTAEVSLTGTKLRKKGQNLAKSYDTSLKLQAAGIDAHAAGAYFGAKDVPAVRLAWLTALFAGEPESPRTWSGNLAVRAEAADFGKVKVDSAEAEIDFKEGQAHVQSALVTIGRNVLALTASAELPDSINDFSRTDGNADFHFETPDLPGITAGLLPGSPVAGTVNGRGKITIHAGKAAGNAEIDMNQVGNEQLGLATARIKLEAAKPLGGGGDSPLTGLDGRATADFTGLRYNTFIVDSAALDAEAHGETITIHRIDVLRAENQVTVQGTCQIPKNGADFLSTPLDAKFTIAAPRLDTFGLGVRDTILKGRLEGSGDVQVANQIANGSVKIDGADFSFGDFKAQSFSAKATVANNEAVLDEVRLQIDGSSQLSVAGKAGLQKPNGYEGAALVLFKDLRVLRPLLEIFGIREEIGGAVDLSIEGHGKLQPQELAGQVKLSVDKARYGKIDLQQARIAGVFGSNFAESSQLHVVSGATTFDGALEWRDQRLKLRDINLRQGTQQALSGYVTIPFEPQSEQLIPFDKRIAANINATQLDVEKLLTSFGQTAPAGGNVTANLVAGGTLFEPFANLKVGAKGLKAKSVPQLDAAEFDLNAHYSEKELTLDATARQRDIQPLTIKGRVPLDFDATLREKSLDPNLPIDLNIKLPASSLAVLPKVVPAIRSASGTVALDARVTGTVGKPQLTGSAALKLDYARMKSEGVPPIGALQANLAFSQDSVTVQKLHGDVGGGTFDLSGKVQFPKITEPVFDLHLKSNSVLVRRDDSVTIRVDSDLAATGPLAAGKVAGTVWVTQSRFVRDIEILPIALPGRPKPQPRSVPSQGSVALGPPLSGWTFDLAIKTRPNDPFQIRGNLANGTAALDLKFGGTGQQPWLDGTIHIENFVASLPFSKLNVTRGFVTFSPDAPFEPKIDLSAESTLRQYHILANIYGDAKNPQLSLTSEPPLTQADILSLLATGTTTSELTGNSDVLASRAAVLLFQQLYRKVFKKKDPSESVPLLDRFNVDVGAVDSRTGRQEVAASFKLSDQFYLVGDIDVTGGFSGRVKYLLRFK